MTEVYRDLDNKSDRWKPESFTEFVEDRFYNYVKDKADDTSLEWLPASWILPLFNDRLLILAL